MSVDHQKMQAKSDLKIEKRRLDLNDRFWITEGAELLILIAMKKRN